MLSNLFLEKIMWVLNEFFSFGIFFIVGKYFIFISFM